MGGCGLEHFEPRVVFDDIDVGGGGYDSDALYGGSGRSRYVAKSDGSRLGFWITFILTTVAWGLVAVVIALVLHSLLGLIVGVVGGVLNLGLVLSNEYARRRRLQHIRGSS